MTTTPSSMPAGAREIRGYAAVRAIAEAHGGRMWHECEGYPLGAWIAEIGAHRCVFLSNGSGYPRLDWLYLRKAVHPTHDSDFTDQLVADAEQAFLTMVKAEND